MYIYIYNCIYLPSASVKNVLYSFKASPQHQQVSRLHDDIKNIRRICPLIS